MKGQQRYSNDVVCLDLSTTMTTPSSSNSTSSSSCSSSSLSIDAVESAETKIQRLISEHPVIIFSRSSCCMCHVMKNLLAAIGVHPTVIELDEDEISALPPPHHDSNASRSRSNSNSAPAVFIGGTCIGGLESLFALHLRGHLLPMLLQVGSPLV